jgi:hypothetical protein
MFDAARIARGAFGSSVVGMVKEELMLVFLYGAFGAFALEFLKLRELYGKLPARRFRMLIRCPAFWIFSGGLILVSGCFTVIAHPGATPEQGLAAALVGAGFRSFGREGLGAAVHNKALVQGGGDDRITLRDILS